jgi:mono/diheme cytochrome c family protein
MLRVFSVFGLGLLVIFGLASAPARAEEILSSIARGGRLYDNWHAELGEHTRRISHLPQTAATGAAGRGSGRCVECHGWDYLGKDGAMPTEYKGIDGSAGADPKTVVNLLRDDNHGFASLLASEDLTDLALLVTRGQVAMDDQIDRTTGQVKGVAARGTVYFQTICANCHGTDGQQIDNMPPLGHLARENPWQALHSMLNGHPNGSMPALRALDPALLADTLAYIQALPARDPTAAIVRGGRLYANWYKEKGREAPAGLHPAFPADKTEGMPLQNSWRCVECHGWDYRGRDGVTAETGRNLGIKGISGMTGADPRAIVAILRDQTHRYGGLLSERDVLDLANFVSRGQVDMARFVDRDSRRIKGDAVKAEPYYQTICATCHGREGRQVRTMPPLGRMAVDDPWHAVHSVFNGHPGDAMPPLRAMPEDIIAGVLAFAQTLPTRK